MTNERAYKIYGEHLIDPEAIKQMDNAMKLPISVGGALMSDAHLGYGLSIGGVLATVGAVIPYAVGVDIACRVRLTVFNIQQDVVNETIPQALLERALTQGTRFGAGGTWSVEEYIDHPVMHDAAWESSELLASLKDTARAQLGTTGGGNHFADWCWYTSATKKHKPYLALMTHSGSRGFGFKVANHFTQLAKEQHPEGGDLAWLGMDTQAGQDYWYAMNLAGRYAAANHELIHLRVRDIVNEEAFINEWFSVENHHNFAWVEQLDGCDVIVHRKGATPAGLGVRGVIPATAGDSGVLVVGKGSSDSLNSASHGAGRALGRRQAKRELTIEERDAYLRENGVTLLGGGLDEAPQAYKRMSEVMEAQADLVEVQGYLKPFIVRMADERGYD